MLSVEHFWTYSCSSYDREEVKASCLTLQDRYQCNVNVLLLCSYLQTQGLALSLAVIEQCLTAIKDTDNQLYQLRQIRREVKGNNEQAYDYLLRAELAIERQQQQLLIDTANRQQLDAAKNQQNVLSYAQHLGLEHNNTVLSLLATLHT